MPQPGSGRILALVALIVVCGAMLLSCAKDPVRVDRNRPPETFLVSAPVDTSVQVLKYSYRIHLYWRGEDPDGYVVGFLWAWDDSSIGSFQFTSKTDSIFELTVNDSSQVTGGTGQNPGTARAHTFFIRAVDNLGKPDPSLSIFNRRIFNAETVKPQVTFTGDIPTPVPGVIDTLCDGAPFSVCWRGRDPDGVVTRYRYDVGSYHSPISTDSCAYFNDPTNPAAVSLSSGYYTMTVTAIDNANATGTNTAQFVANRDPETWFIPKDGDPIGHYIQYFLGGDTVNIQGTFAPGDTVPYRSTIWWEWDGEDSHGGCEKDSLQGWSFRLDNGTRNDRQPYIIGVLDVLSQSPLIRFNNNNPGPLAQAGFTSLILDSLDEGLDIIARVASRDNSGRSDGTPASFRFNCNFPPRVEYVAICDTLADPDQLGAPESCQVIYWFGSDYEDGFTKSAQVTINDTRGVTLNNFEQMYIVPNRVFRALSPGAEHTVKVRVADRAEIKSPVPAEGPPVYRFNIPHSPPCSLIE